jgi:hypothetical protein
MQLLDARFAKPLHSPRMKSLRAARVRNLDARGARHLRTPGPRRLAQASGRGFLPGFAGMGLVEDLDQTDVQVGYEDSALAGGMMPGLGAFDIKSVLTIKNVGICLAAAAASYFFFKRN